MDEDRYRRPTELRYTGGSHAGVLDAKCFQEPPESIGAGRLIREKQLSDPPLVAASIAHEAETVNNPSIRSRVPPTLSRKLSSHRPK